MKMLISTRRVFAFALVIAFTSCNLNTPPPEQDDTSRINDSGDEGSDNRPELPRSITLRLADYGEYNNGSIGIGLGNIASSLATNSPTANSRRDMRSKSRALTYENAQAFHDYFEAVFYHPDTQTVARAVWDIGVTPELRGVYRTTEGIDYSYITSEAVTTADEGCAVLFVGSKADKTLLAVGKLSGVDGTPGDTTIDLNTKSVTFEVDALKAGVNTNAANKRCTSI